MKSLTYMLTRNPQCFDDCLDYARKSHLVGVSLDLETTEIYTVRPVGRQLVAQFHFRFVDRSVSFERILGGCLNCESEKKQLKIIQAANRRLERYLERARSVCPEIVGPEKRFDKKLVYSLKTFLMAPKAV